MFLFCYCSRPGVDLDILKHLDQSVHQRIEQRLQLEARLHELLDALHGGSVAGKHFALRRHHVWDEGVAPALLLRTKSTHTHTHKM